MSFCTDSRHFSIVFRSSTNHLAKSARAEERVAPGRLTHQPSPALTSPPSNHVIKFFSRLTQSWDNTRVHSDMSRSLSVSPPPPLSPPPPKDQVFILGDGWTSERAARHLLRTYRISVKAWSKPSRGGVTVKHKDIDEAVGTGARVEVEEVRGRGEDEWVPGFHTDPVGAEEMTGRSFGCPAIA